MPPYPTPTTPIIHLLTRDICTMDNHHFYRRKGTTKWIEYPPETPPPPPEQDTRISNSTYLLSLFQEKPGPGKPLHWSFFVAREGESTRAGVPGYG
ncbi:hypothetical protein BDQ94DRAFT_153135 [Aspergillus welwitschiae]|uniref:Uncharacterized protein n=1 Tax=Aspergillus welwitschiae TaxID=1341132 RepID=A0A3F3PLK7_9EURO|nr:hypothetical protein BDQ94DRAFT_153135 [Aspergillus welwitschiae]RDH27797.1 hypothetical protein BDQ94DRAFT_153135 [Aspergillus welwitschiae]